MQSHLEAVNAQIDTLLSIREFCEDKHKQKYIDWLLGILTDHLEALEHPSTFILVDSEVRAKLEELRLTFNNLISHLDIVFDLYDSFKVLENQASQISQLNWVSIAGIDISGLDKEREKVDKGLRANVSKFFNRIRWKKAHIGSKISWVSVRSHQIIRERNCSKKVGYQLAADEWKAMIDSIGD